ncbi:UNVERIFIED_CONTAM: hypothetical protein Sradi_4878300, partial [Sesamum radiatum]
SSVAKVRGGQVNKLIEVQSLELYCNTVEKTEDSSTENAVGYEKLGRERFENQKFSSMLAPLDVSVSLSVIEQDVQHELEEMEKETDIDDILDYRSVAERELEDFLVNPSLRYGSNSGNVDKSVEDDRPPSKARGWLNWLSYGMLGAGGTDDSDQFSGVISDDVIKVSIFA